MSTTRSHTRRVTTVVVAVATATGVAWAGPSAAGGHPGVFDSETCAASLTRVWFHPGRLGDDGPLLFSDAYESYVLRQPPCDATRPAPSIHDRDRMGHGDPL
ncbi:hypothetical protein [Blastococcus brunescens]|uniref:Secreted protein n=1 Tax=Blastococcus brunescens TaxID=1564165 RepID=A0ABZ1AXV6_9ACTN|nr:hypothetical protein [Blastococcus sp. BMG 8361]WRL62957.1 hypothetical protein U6N30_24340 [Blastococcus sp. BMG 8361]